MHSFVFDGQNSVDYVGLYVSRSDTDSAPERDIESIPIPGRNGELTIDHGNFKNMKISYNGWIYKWTDNYDLEIRIRRARAWLLHIKGYARLEDDYHTDEYRMARLTSGVNFSIDQNTKVATTKIEFDCMPQRWLISGENVITIPKPAPSPNPNTVSNPTFFASKPLLIIHGTGSGQVNISSDKYYRIDITDIAGELIIDSETGRAYSGNPPVSRNEDIKLYSGYPILKGKSGYESDSYGNSRITFSDGVTSVDVIPRWWRI